MKRLVTIIYGPTALYLVATGEILGGAICVGIVMLSGAK